MERALSAEPAPMNQLFKYLAYTLLALVFGILLWVVFFINAYFIQWW